MSHIEAHVYQKEVMTNRRFRPRSRTSSAEEPDAKGLDARPDEANANA